MLSKRLLLTLLVLVLALILAACGGADQPAPVEEAAPEEAAPEEAAPVEEAAPEEAAPEGEKVTLTIDSWRNDDIPIWQDVIIPAFNEQYPEI